MNFKRFLAIFGIICLAVVIVFSWGCQNQPTAPQEVGNDTEQLLPVPKLSGYSSGTHDGYFWSLWTDDRGGWVDYQNGSGGNYSVSWDYDGNFTCGKGWSSGSTNRVVGYNIGAHTHNSGGVFGYYGWSRNPLMEYYVNERWGRNRPTGTRVGSVSSDGGSYDIYTAWRSNAPSIDGTQSFRQIFSTRTSQNSTGSNHTITFANHANAWRNSGYGLGSDMSPAAILLTEAYGGGSGYVNATVWSAGSSSGGGGSSGGSSGGGGITGVKRLRNRGTGLYLDGMGRTNNGADCGQYANTNHANAHWNITDAGSGYYYLINQGTNMRLDGYGRTGNGDACAQYMNTTHQNAQWRFEDAGSGHYYLVNRGTGMKLDGYGRTGNGSTCAQYMNTTHQNAQWQLVD
jgi:hypothetical protein